MDLLVWSSRPFDLPDQLPEPKMWIRYRNQWAFEKKGWQVLVLPARRSEANVPEPEAAVLQKLTVASHVAYVTLEPIGADRAAFLEKVVRGLALALVYLAETLRFFPASCEPSPIFFREACKVVEYLADGKVPLGQLS